MSEPVAWLIHSSVSGKDGVLLHAKQVTTFGSGGAESEFTQYETSWMPLYAHPDPRIVEYRKLLREVVGSWDNIMEDRATYEALIERIRAALKDSEAAIKGE